MHPPEDEVEPLPTLVEVVIPNTVEPVELVTATPTILLDRADFVSVVQYVSYAIRNNQSEMFADLIGDSGVLFAPYAVGAAPPGYNNADEVVPELRQALEGAEPQCLGYNALFGTQPDKAMIVLSGLRIDWAGMGMTDLGNDLVTFQFWNLGGGWSLTFITNLYSDFWVNMQLTLTACP